MPIDEIIKFLQSGLNQDEVVIFKKLNTLVYGGTLNAQIISASTTQADDLMIEIFKLQNEIRSLINSDTHRLNAIELKLNDIRMTIYEIFHSRPGVPADLEKNINELKLLVYDYQSNVGIVKRNIENIDEKTITLLENILTVRSILKIFAISFIILSSTHWYSCMNNFVNILSNYHILFAMILFLCFSFILIKKK